MSATDNLGPHLLGRLPSPPDARDYKLEDYLAAPSNATIAGWIDTAVKDHLKLTTVGYAGHSLAWQNRTTTQWYQGLALLTQAYNALQGTPAPPAPTGDVKWADTDGPLDQGQQGTCVGHGTAQWGNTLPVDDHFTHQDALDLYYQATVYDGQPDDPRAPGGGQQGASVRSGMKALQNKGRLSAYASASSVSAVTTWVRTKGPLVIGSDWTNDMFNPVNGYVKPTGGVAGGHCYLLTGDLASEGAFQFLNSWGSGWALGGWFKMKYADFGTLFGNGGEAWTAVELP